MMRPTKSLFYHANCCLLAALATALLFLEKIRADDRPNMIFVMSDDQGWGDVAYNGHPILKTPNLDEMAASGICFNRFYAGASVCSPTATCLTGRNNWGWTSWPSGRRRRTSPETKSHLQKFLRNTIRHWSFRKWHVGGFDPETAGPMSCHHGMRASKSAFQLTTSCAHSTRTKSWGKEVSKPATGITGETYLLLKHSEMRRYKGMTLLSS